MLSEGYDHEKSTIPHAPVAGVLDSLFDSNESTTPYSTYVFLALCYLITIPSLLYPKLYGIFGGIEPRPYPWQLFTAVFEHGWPGFHGSIHLALNTILILECGRPCERLLGSRRFLLLCFLSMLANAGTQLYTEGVNGSSLVIWAWGPPLFVALKWAKSRDRQVRNAASFGRIRGILIIMYGVVVVVMALLPYLAGWRGNPLVSLLMGNLYHLVAAGVGIICAFFWAGYLRLRLNELGQSQKR